jgi:hypothetical protein
MATAIVTITSDPEVVTSPQTTSVLVSLEGLAPQQHIAVWFDDQSSETREGFRRQLKDSNPSAIVSVVTNDSEGSCDCTSEMNGSTDPFSIAAAVAVVKSSWGWDEADPILVRINGRPMPVRARYNGTAWVATDA